MMTATRNVIKPVLPADSPLLVFRTRDRIANYRIMLDSWNGRKEKRFRQWGAFHRAINEQGPVIRGKIKVIKQESNIAGRSKRIRIGERGRIRGDQVILDCCQKTTVIDNDVNLKNELPRNNEDFAVGLKQDFQSK